MGQSVSAVEARQKLGEILNRVSLRGEEIIIERAGKKIARLSPVDKEIWKGLDVDEYLRGERDPWA